MLRLSEDDFTELQRRIDAKTAMATPRTKKTRKYGSQPTVVDGIRFDSKAEARRYIQLKALQMAKEITNLQLQVSFNLLPGQDRAGRKERKVDYIRDFVYKDKDGVTIYEDVKSGPTKTAEFILKRKMMLFFHGIVVREVMMD